MKTNLLFAVICVSFVCAFAACTPSETLEIPIIPDENQTVELRKNPIPIIGLFNYGSGQTNSLIQGQYYNHGMEDLNAVFHVTDANPSIITFRSTQYNVGASVTITDDNENVFTVYGLRYADEHSTYLRINSTEIFNALPYPFNFKFALTASNL